MSSSSFSMAARNLRRRRTRTILTVSGIVVGIALIVVLLSLTAGTSASANRLIREILPAQITVLNSTTPTGNGAGVRALFESDYLLNQSTTTEIDSFAGVYAVTGELSSTAYLNGQQVFLSGIDPSTYSNVTGGLNILSGTTLSPSAGTGEYQAVLGQTIAGRLGIAVGAHISVGANPTGGTTFTVVGIYSSGSTVLDRSVYIPLSDAQAITGDQGKISEIYVKVNTQSNVTSVAREIDATVPGVRVVTSPNLVTAASSLTGTLTVAFTVIGLVALLAGAFGVVNTMMMAVGERTREIGTLKALGATEGRIMTIFISEAFLIGVIGGICGAVIGTIASLGIAFLTGTSNAGLGLRGLSRGATLSPSVTPELILLSLALGVCVGVLAGIYPAWRASRMNPVEALRHV